MCFIPRRGRPALPAAFGQILFVLLLLEGSAQGGQRILSVVDPAAQGLDLKFDINEVKSDNVAPNLLFTADGTRGLVAYTGSGTIVAFTPIDGKIVGRVETGGQPSQIVLTPDGTRLLAVDVFSNRIFSIALSDFTLADTYTFPDAFFGFGSNAVISADGQTAYISTFRFDTIFEFPIEGELIRFDPKTGAETGSRAKTERGPAAISLSPDQSTIAVVNTISETVTLVDTSSFNVKATVKPEGATDFTFVNNVAFSADSSAGVVSSRAAASLFLASDRAFVFSSSDGEILSQPPAGIVPSSSFLSPDGKYFYLLNQFGFNVLDAQTFQLFQNIQTPFGQFFSNSNIAFRSDSSIGFVASPISDVIMSFRVNTGGVESALPLRPKSSGEIKQSLQVAVTPDDTTVCSLNFMDNTISCAVDTFDQSFPGLEVDAARFSGMSLVNTTDQAIPFTIEAINSNSISFVNEEFGLLIGQDERVALTGTGKLAQSFQPAVDLEVNLMTALLKKTGSFSDTAKLVATLQTDDNGAPSGTLVENAAAEIPAEAVGTTLDFVRFNFDTEISLAAGTTYWLVLEGGGTYESEFVEGANSIDWGVDASLPLLGSGQFATFTSSWTADISKDALFSAVSKAVANPQRRTLQPAEQFLATQDLFQFDDQEREGRVLIQADTPGLKGYWVTGTRDLQRLDGSLPDSEGHRDLILPEVMQLGDVQTGLIRGRDDQVILTNTGKLAQSFQLESAAAVDLIRMSLGKTGSFTSTATLQISIQTDESGAPSGAVLENGMVEIPADSPFLVPSLIAVRFENPVNLQPGTPYWIVLEGGGSYESEFMTGSQLIDWGVDGSSPPFDSGQFATFDAEWTVDETKDAIFSVILQENLGLDTRYNFINRNFTSTNVGFELLDANGDSLERQITSLAGRSRLVGTFEDVFQNTVPDRIGGYVRIRSLSPTESFEEFGVESSVGILPAIPVDEAALSNTKLVFPHFASSPNIETTLNLINISREEGLSTGQDSQEILTGTGKLAQSFEVENDVKLTLVRVLLVKVGTFTEMANLRATLQSDEEGSPSGIPLEDAFAEVGADSVGTSFTTVNLRFSSSIPLQANTTYWLVLEGSGTYETEFSSMVTTISWAVDASSPPLVSGQFSVFADNAWTADPDRDALFNLVLSEDNELTISLYSPDGDLLAPPLKKILTAGGQLRRRISELFPTLNVPNGTQGWILVESDKPGIVGDVLFANSTMDFMTAGLLQLKPLGDILFAQVAQGAGFQTAWALLNDGDVPCDVTLDVLDSNGTLTATHSMRLNAKSNFTAYFHDLFPEISELLGGYVRIRSTRPLYSFSIFNDDGFNFISMIPPQPFK